MEDGEEKLSPYDGEVREKEQKDAELDKKIKALKKKNEALVQRHREIEQDRLRAEKDGMAVTSQRPKPDSLTITITKTPNEKRIVRNVRRSSDGTEQSFTLLMGNEMQLSVSMDSKVEATKTISKKIDQDVLFLTSKTSKLSMEEVNDVFSFSQGPHMQIAISRHREFAMPKVERKRENTKKKCKTQQNKKSAEKCEMSCSDNPMSAMEPSEYLQWKKERERVDTERLARQRNSKGEWRRTWDKGKTHEMSECAMCYVDTVPSAFCGRRGVSERKMHIRETVTENKGVGNKICNEKPLRMMNTISSRAKGKDRLTGRAKRCYSYSLEQEDFSYIPEDFPVQKSLDGKVAVKHSEGNFKEDEFLNTEKRKVSVQDNSSANEEKIVFANEKIVRESKQDVPFHGKRMEVRRNDLSEGRGMLEYLSVLSCDSEPGEDSANPQDQRSS